MTEALNKLIKEELINLPKESQEVLNSFDWVKITEEIAKKYNLSEDQINHFQAVVAIILFGLDEIDTCLENLENEFRVSEEIFKKIIEEVYEKILTPIKTLVEERAKTSFKGKEMNWQQSVDFIISGGDYSSLINNANDRYSHDTQKPEPLLGAKSMQDMKDRLIN